jgi:hypothetical protein
MIDNKVVMDKSKEKLKAFLGTQITTLFSEILDFTEVAVGDKERHKILRSKILKVSNDAIRTISREVDEKYLVEFVSKTEDLIIVRK